MPAAQDRESYGHTKTDKPLKTEQQPFAVGGGRVVRCQRHTTALCDASVCVCVCVCMTLHVCILVSLGIAGKYWRELNLVVELKITIARI